MDWMPDILIVDDNQRMADSMEMLLGARGYTTRAVYDPHEALEPIASGTFGIVLLDLCMPGMTGFEVMDRVGVNREQVEFIIITGDKFFFLARLYALPAGVEQQIHGATGHFMEHIIFSIFVSTASIIKM